MDNDDSVKTITGLMELNERRTGTVAIASELMHQLMREVSLTRNKGKMVITFEISCDKNEELGLLIDSFAKITAMPERPRRKALVFHDAKHNLFSRKDPRQMELLAEREAERVERAQELADRGIARIGRGEQAV